MNAAKMIIRARKRAGISKAEAARRCGMSRQSYHVLERGDYDPRLATLVSVAKALGCRLVCKLEGR
jgi:DNA-binding XRE family transcriptional regulator